MLCHKSKPNDGTRIPCAGYVVVVGYDSIGIRLATSRGEIVPEVFVSDTPLYSSFEEMMRANNVEPPPRNRRTPRP